MLSHSSHFKLFVTVWAIAHQAPLFMGFSRQEYWSGLPCLPAGYLPNPGIEPGSFISPALTGSLPLAPSEKRGRKEGRILIHSGGTFLVRQYREIFFVPKAKLGEGDGTPL